MMKKLWIVTELFPPDETSTAYILGEVANACSSEYEVHVLCGPAVYDPRKQTDTAHPFELNPDVAIHRVEGYRVDKNRLIGKALSFVQMSRKLYGEVKKDVESGDKVLLVTNPAPLLLFVSRLRKNRAFEFNLLVHDIFPENTVPAGLRLPKIFLGILKRWFDRAYSRVDRFIAIGRDMKLVIEQKAGPRARVEIVENWADVDLIHPEPFQEGPVRLEYAGNLGRVQGLDKLVSELPAGIQLHFYGTGAMEESLKKMNHPNVFFHGPYFRYGQNEVLGACHAAIVSLSDKMFGLGVPSKAYNIMAAGRPIIYFGPENGEIGMLVKEQAIGFIGWPDRWDLEEWKEMGKRARHVAECVYSKPVIMRKFLSALR